MQVGHPSRTALGAAMHRAVHQTLEGGSIFTDPYALQILDEEARANLAAFASDSTQRSMRLFVSARSRFSEEAMAACIARGARQVVILGAGLDTRAVRKRSVGVQYFEIDDPETMELKQRCYADAGIDTGVRLIRGNYVTDGLIDLLRSNGFRFDVPTYLIWEGNVMYMPLANDKETMRQLKQHLMQFRVSFDYLTEAVVTKATGDPGLTILVEAFEAMGAPWVSGIDDIHALARDVGLRVVDNITTGELYRKYRGRPSTSAILRHYSICTLES